MVNKFHYWLLPGACILCGGASKRPLDLCRACEQDLPRLDTQCVTCALPLSSENANFCADCMQQAPAFQQTVCAWRYEAAIASLLSQFKYQRHHSYGEVLCQLYIDVLQQAYAHKPWPHALMATPMHWRRRLWRGFNHAEQVSTYLSRALQIPQQRQLQRVQSTAPQQSLNAKQRQRNLRSAFAVKNRGEPLAGKTIAVVDDVMTTGATANAMATTLLKAGAKAVHIWCLARTAK